MNKVLDGVADIAGMSEIPGKRGVINRDLAEKLSDMARFRNIPVYGYAKVDNARFLETVRGELLDVKEFVREILKPEPCPSP